MRFDNVTSDTSQLTYCLRHGSVLGPILLAGLSRGPPIPIHAESVYEQGDGSGQNPAHVAQIISGPRSAIERGKVA